MIAKLTIVLYCNIAVAAAQSEENMQYEQIKRDLPKIESFSHDNTAAGNAADKMRLKAYSGLDSYVISSIRLSIRHEYQYLEYCWLLSEDSLKRIVIACVLLIAEGGSEDWRERLINSAKRFSNKEQVARLEEIKWVVNNKEWLAKNLSVLVKSDAETLEFIKGINKSLKK